MASRDVPRVRLRTPGELAAALPFLLGFHPEESLIAIGVADAQVSLVTRVDLPPPGDVPRLASVVTGHLAHAAADGALLAVVTERVTAADAVVSALPLADLVRCLADACSGSGIEVREALLVRSGRWCSYYCRTPGCCPPGGTAVDPRAAAELAAASAWIGDVVHPRREDLQRLLAPVGLFARAGLDQAFERVGRQLLEEVEDRGRAAVAAESRQLLAAAVLRRAEAPAVCTDAEVARLAIGLADVAVRDQALGWAGGDLEHAAEALWVELVRKASPPHAAAPATLLAAQAYLRGNGAFARIAVERALHSDPGYSFARLLADGLDHGVPPRALRSALRAVGDAA